MFGAESIGYNDNALRLRLNAMTTERAGNIYRPQKVFQILVGICVSTLFSFLLLCSPLLASQTSSVKFYETISVDQLLELMQDQDYNVEKTEDDDVLWRIDGYSTWIIPMHGDSSLLFYTGFTDAEVTLRKVNDWNGQTLYARSYLDDDGDPILEHALNLSGGVTESRILDFVSISRDIFIKWQRDVVRY